MRIGLVGVGRIGKFHATTLKALDGVEQVVVTDSDAARARVVARELGLEAVADVETLLGSGLDGIAICAPTSAHAELIGRAQDAGLITFCEKPVAPDLSATRAAINRVPDRAAAPGFSQNVMSPASWARPISSACALVGAQMAMPSRPDPKSVSTSATASRPSSLATTRARAASESVTTTCSTPSRAFSVVAWNFPIRPTPTNPMRMLRTFQVDGPHCM